MLRLCVAAATLGLAAGHGLMTTPAPRAGTTNAGTLPPPAPKTARFSTYHSVPVYLLLPLSGY